MVYFNMDENLEVIVQVEKDEVLKIFKMNKVYQNSDKLKINIIENIINNLIYHFIQSNIGIEVNYLKNKDIEVEVLIY